MVMALISHPEPHPHPKAPPPTAVHIVAMAITKSSNHRYGLSPMSTFPTANVPFFPCPATVKSGQSKKQVCQDFVLYV